MRKIKVVQIGLGHDHALQILDSMLRLPDVFEVVGFAVPQSEETDFKDRVEKYRDEKGIRQFTIDEALNVEGLDGVVIETEELVLTHYAILAAEKGYNIHMDKPGGINLAEFEKLISIVKEKNLVFTLGYMYRFNKKIIEAMQKIENGEIGEVYAVEAHMDCEHVPEKRQWLDRFPGGMLFYLGCHLIDLIYRIQGEPKKIIPLSTSTKFDGVTAEDYGMVVYEYENGISFAKTCANEVGGFLRRQLVICGTKGTIEIRPLEKYYGINPTTGGGDQTTVMRYVDARGDWSNDGIRTESEPADRYDDMMVNFAQLVCKEKENPYTYDYELNLYKLLLKSCGEEI